MCKTQLHYCYPLTSRNPPDSTERRDALNRVSLASAIFCCLQRTTPCSTLANMDLLSSLLVYQDGHLVPASSASSQKSRVVADESIGRDAATAREPEEVRLHKPVNPQKRPRAHVMSITRLYSRLHVRRGRSLQKEVRLFKQRSPLLLSM